jgi:hypothetical protein
MKQHELYVLCFCETDAMAVSSGDSGGHSGGGEVLMRQMVMGSDEQHYPTSTL